MSHLFIHLGQGRVESRTCFGDNGCEAGIHLGCAGLHTFTPRGNLEANPSIVEVGGNVRTLKKPRHRHWQNMGNSDSNPSSD